MNNATIDNLTVDEIERMGLVPQYLMNKWCEMVDDLRKIDSITDGRDTLYDNSQIALSKINTVLKSIDELTFADDTPDSVSNELRDIIVDLKIAADVLA